MNLTSRLRSLIRNLLEFVRHFSTIQNFTLTKDIERYLEGKVFFSQGHDRKFRPVIYIFPTKIKEVELELFRQSFKFYLMMVEKYLMRDYHIENWVTIIDLEKKGLMGFPFKAIQATINVTSMLFAGRMHNLFMVNPTFMFYGLWKLISNFLPPDMLEKIHILKRKGFGKILDLIDKEQLLEKYGGTMVEHEQVLPMRTTFEPNEKPLMNEKDLTENNFIEPNVDQKSDNRLSVKLSEKRFSQVAFANFKDWDVI
jgi:hypothetical protein